MKSSFSFRGVQLDLARQLETLEFIKEFIDMIAANGYNVLFLYLEGRIRTESFPYAADNECYTTEQMHEIVEYASSKGIDVVPGISLLGHAELFLKYEELAEIAELRNDRNGRFWSNKKIAFCPSQEATYEFFEKYLKEVCYIFPSEYFHIGLDEAWDIGYCKKCKEKAVDFTGEQQLFLDNLLRCRKILSALDKRVMMWDDMFEYYRDILIEVPRDVIMVKWQYAADVQHYKGHFANLKVDHILAEYDRLGFEYIIAPSDYSSSNIRTFTEYSENFKPLGGLVTSWEKSTCFLYKSIPAMAYAGRLWSDSASKDEIELFADAMESIFGLRDEKLLTLLRTNTEHGLDNEKPVSLSTLMTSSYFGFDYSEFETLNFQKYMFEEIQPMIKSQLGSQIINDIIEAYTYNILKYRLHKAARDLFEPMRDSFKAKEDIDIIYQETKELGEKRIQRWKEYRTGIVPCKMEKIFEDYLKLIESLPSLAKNNVVMRVRFCLPDSFSAEQCNILLKYSGEWHDIFSGCCKSSNANDVFYTTNFLLPSSTKPEAFKLESRGYGGQGLAFVEILTDSGCYVTSAIRSTIGKVIDPEHVLDNDCKWSFIGEKNTLKAFKNRKLAEERHSIEYSLIMV
jgi:Glycosyl hydrolase family 20, catalytic domain